MAMNKAVKELLRVLSFGGIEVNTSRHLAELKALSPMKRFYKTINYKVYNGDYKVPMRIYFPSEDMDNECPVLLFFHGGGWVTESIDTYQRICALMAKETGHAVVAVEYRLAPEHPFPIGLMDCYAAAEAIYSNHFILNIHPDKITLIGDSAGGNLTAAISLMARDKGSFLPKRQILIYPAVNSDFSKNSPFRSVKENGKDYLLTQEKMQAYINLYASKEEDKQNPYFAPIYAKDYTNQPKTLVLTAEFDPLRDEGEEYARRLKEAGNEVRVHRIKDALHGYFALGIKHLYVKKSLDLMNQFLQER